MDGVLTSQNLIDKQIVMLDRWFEEFSDRVCGINIWNPENRQLADMYEEKSREYDRVCAEKHGVRPAEYAFDRFRSASDRVEYSRTQKTDMELVERKLQSVREDIRKMVHLPAAGTVEQTDAVKTADAPVSQVQHDEKAVTGRERAYRFSQIAVDRIRSELQESTIPVSEYAFLDNLLDSLERDPINFRNSVVLMAEENYNRTNLEIIDATRDISMQLGMIAEKGISEADLDSINRNVEKIKNNVLRHEENSRNALIRWAAGKDAEFGSYQSLNEAKANSIGGIDLAMAAGARKSARNGMKALNDCREQVSSFHRMVKGMKMEAKTAGLFLKTTVAKISMQYYMKQINGNKSELSVLETALQETGKKLEQYEKTSDETNRKYRQALGKEEKLDTAIQWARQEEKYYSGKISRIKGALISDAEELKRLVEEVKGKDVVKEAFAERVIQNNMKKIEFCDPKKMMEMAQKRAEERNRQRKQEQMPGRAGGWKLPENAQRA